MQTRSSISGREVNRACVFVQNQRVAFPKRARDLLVDRGIEVEMRRASEFPEKGCARNLDADLIVLGDESSTLAEIKKNRYGGPLEIVYELLESRKIPIFGQSSFERLEQLLIENRIINSPMLQAESVLAAAKASENLEGFANHGAGLFARALEFATQSWVDSHTERTNLPFEKHISISGELLEVLRYGENPHQIAALYSLPGERRPGVTTARQIQGKELSYNNLNDTDAAYELVAEFGDSSPAAVIVKHANPCGVAVGDSLADAYAKALKCDPVSAFGGVIALNKRVDREAAAEITKIFTEVVIAPSADEEALALFATKKNLRVLLADALPDPRAPGRQIKTISGGFLLQSRDDGYVNESGLRIPTKRLPTKSEMRDMLFAFKVAKHVKSNAIVYAKNEATVGIGAGQMSRVDSSRIAARKSADAAKLAGEPRPLAVGSVVASDAFFPFPDGLLVAAEAGVTAVIQPGGSIRDQDVIDAADDAGLAMAFTDMRHFRH